LAVSRLNLLVAAEPDQLVWRSVLTAIAGDGSEAAVRLAGAGLSHPAAEVRRRACEHLAAHPSERTAKLLMPALEDDSLSVVCAAVRALAAAGRIDDTEPLHRLLGRGNEYVRIETAVALRRLGDAAGTDELKRLSYSSDPEIRRRVASSLGERPEPEFMPALIRMLDDRRASVRSAALASLPKVAGQRAADTVESESATTTERIRRWKQWYQRRG